MSVLLDFQIIREDTIPTIPPTVEKINVFRFIPGEKRTIAIQLINAYNKKPYVLPTGWTASIEIKATDPDVPLVKALTIDSLDRSVMSAVLSAVETLDIVSGKLKVTVVETADATNKMIALKDGIFSKIKEEC